MSKVRIKIVSGYILGFIFSLILVVLMTSIILKLTVFNKSYVYRVLEENNYYEIVSKEIRTKMGDYMMSSGLPDSILDDTFTVNDVKKDINLYINNYYKNTKTKLNVDDIEKKLSTNINKYLNSRDISIESESVLNDFIKGITKIYKDEVLHYNLLDAIRNRFNKICKIINLILIISVILLVISILLLKFVKFEYINSTFISSGLIILFIILYINSTIDVSSIRIVTENFSNITNVLYEKVEFWLILSAILLIIVGFLEILRETSKKDLKKS